MTKVCVVVLVHYLPLEEQFTLVEQLEKPLAGAPGILVSSCMKSCIDLPLALTAARVVVLPDLPA